MAAGDETLFLPENYRDLRTTLVSYLRRLGSKTAEDLADETVVRVLEKRQAGGRIKDLRAYTLGVAHNVYLEATREPRTIALPDDVVSDWVSEDAEFLDTCLSRCLKHLPPMDRKIVKNYYSESGQRLIENRRKLAAEMGLTMDALRIRAYRIRKGLGTCIGECMVRNKRS